MSVCRPAPKVMTFIVIRPKLWWMLCVRALPKDVTGEASFTCEVINLSLTI